MSNDVIIKKAGKKGMGLFAARDFKKGEIILYDDITKLPKYTLKEIIELHRKNPNLIADHEEYVGEGKYVINISPESFVNHSCDPNAYVEFTEIGKKFLIALKPIKKGEEITKDYQLAAIDQIDKKNGWVLECKCGSKKCRKMVTGDLFKLPTKILLEKLPYVPTWVKWKYRDRIKKLKDV